MYTVLSTILIITFCFFPKLYADTGFGVSEVGTLSSLTPGTTIIVHGLDFLGFVGERSLDDNAQWTLTMAKAIANRIGNAQVYTLVDGILSHRDEYSVGIGGENIIVFDWLDESDRATFGYSEGAGDALASLLIKYSNEGTMSLNQLHFIGHSRGAVVCSEAIQRLNMYKENSGVAVDEKIHFTTLDPHPWDEIDDDDIGDPLWANDHDVNGGQIDFGVVAWDIVSYVDNYWHKGDGLNGLSTFPGCPNNTDLSEKAGNYKDMDHSGIHAWYHGTVDFNAKTDSTDKNAIIIDPDGSWYPGSGTANERKSLGFNYVAAIGGSFNTIPSNNTVSIYDDNTFNITSIFNGDFSKTGYWWDVKWIPGWELHSGGGKGFINLDYANYRLKLNDNNESRTHNSFFVPQGMEGIYFRYRVSNKSNDDHLIVKLNNVKLGEGIPLNDRSLSYINTSVGIPSYAGSVNTLTFEIESKEGGVNSTVYIDDISFQILRYFSVTVASPVHLHAYDSYGNHTGPISDSTWVTEIPNSKYLVIKDSTNHPAKSIILPPLADGNEYTFRIESLDTTAHFGFFLEDNSDESKTSIATFDSILIEPNTVAVTTINKLNSDILLAIDIEGDGNFETSLPPNNYYQNMHVFTSIDGNGTIEPTGDIIVNYGDTLTIKIIPDSGYAISNVLVDSDSLGKVTSYTFSNVISEHMIHAIFVSTTGIDEEKSVPKSFYLNQNYPNPFNPETKISFGLPNSSKVKIDVYNSLGQHLSTLVNKQLILGHHIVTFDGSSLPSGVYFYRIIAGENSKIKKMLLIK